MISNTVYNIVKAVCEKMPFHDDFLNFLKGYALHYKFSISIDSISSPSSNLNTRE